MKSDKEVIIVIGTKYKSQLLNTNIISISNYLNLIKYNNSTNIQDNIIIYIGQGLSEDQEKFLSDAMPAKIFSPFQKANCQITHKKYKRNIMITDPIQLSKQKYNCYLKIDENCDEMKDHLTGGHISAMILLEAARQLNTAIAEKFLFAVQRKSSAGFVVNEIKASFDHYIYPFEVLMSYQLQKFKIYPAGNFKAQGVIKFFQRQKTCVKIFINYSVLPQKYLHTKETAEIENFLNNKSGE